ncbi:MAG: DUF1214 domain-containing protein [Parvibaculum sp.]|uniref:DUF1214 domain-containing protein n=1 Tax=Parvibaculum sp. TaxID=2024848 RepID=UPI003C761933
MKSLLYWGGIVVLAVVLGLGSAMLVMRTGGMGDDVTIGPWHASLAAGSASADMYTRARVARFGLLALDKKETLYYTASTDSAGETLSGSCTYVVTGNDLATRWWSVTAYGPDSFLIPNEAGIYSFSKTTVKREADGHYIVRVSANHQEGNWLPVKLGERFDMTARFYNPDASVYADPGAAKLPTIVKESCK